jgi:aldose sugar dehydrogenase
VRGQDNEEKKTAPLPQTSTISSKFGDIESRVVARNLVHPWGLALLPGGRFLVTERNDGNLRIIDQSGRVSDPVEGVPRIFRFRGETGRSQAGLFDVKLHPGFSENQLVYLSLARPTDRGATISVIRARLEESDSRVARLNQVETIFELQEEDQDSSGLHFGGRMAIDEQNGFLFLSIGDRRNMSRAQDGEDQAGSIVRITLDGDVPRDNPFVADETINDHIFAKGNRNSQALAIHPQNANLWSIDHGPSGGDRVDVVTSGANLGWPFITAGTDYSGAPVGVGLEKDGLVSPTHVFDETIAPSGASFYNATVFGDWHGRLLVGGMAAQSLLIIGVKDDRVTDVEKIEIGRRIRDVQVGQDGAVWLITEHGDGELVRLAPKK